MLTSKIKKIISFSFLTLFLVSLVFPIISSAQLIETPINGGWNDNILRLDFNFDKSTSSSAFFNINYKRDGGDNTTRTVALTLTKSGVQDPTKTQNATITLTKDLSAKEYVFNNLEYSTKYFISGIITINNQVSIESTLYLTTPKLTVTDKDKESKWWYDQTAQWSGHYTKSECIPLAEAFNKTPKPVCKYFESDPNETNPIDFQTITPIDSNVATELNYYPLANLPGVGEDCTKDSSGKETCVVKLAPNCKQDPNFPNDPAKQICTPGLGFAGYLNIMIQIFIGIAAVLAMIMIVMGGIEYMTSELVSSKQAGKERIMHAILGLILALGSYAILNTLNPDLLNVGLGNLPQATVTVLPEAETVPWSTYEVGDDKASCPSGFMNVNVKTTTPNKINVCGSIAVKLANMINTARTANPSILLSGSGSRSKATTQALRVKNNCPDPKTPANNCHPNQVARPGTSNHEKGLAIDFNCNGAPIPKLDKTNVCYVWLSKNASTYGFKNNFNDIQETWHWSTDGN